MNINFWEWNKIKSFFYFSLDKIGTFILENYIYIRFLNIYFPK